MNAHKNGTLRLKQVLMHYLGPTLGTLSNMRTESNTGDPGTKKCRDQEVSGIGAIQGSRDPMTSGLEHSDGSSQGTRDQENRGTEPYRDLGTRQQETTQSAIVVAFSADSASMAG